MAIFGLGPTEIILILVVAVLVFGRRLPEVARSVGKNVFELRRQVTDVQRQIHEATSDVSKGLDIADAIIKDREEEKASEKEAPQQAEAEKAAEEKDDTSYPEDDPSLDSDYRKAEDDYAGAEKEVEPPADAPDSEKKTGADESGGAGS